VGSCSLLTVHLFRAQMDSLMRNDWPDTDTGIRTAFRFAMPEGANEMIVVSLLCLGKGCAAFSNSASQLFGAEQEPHDPAKLASPSPSQL